MGFYNPGYNTRVCSKCPGGLTTANEGSTSTAQCKAPAGSYYLRGRAIACAQGTYKAQVANADCDECAAGLTTTFGEVGKTAVTDCAGEPRRGGLGTHLCQGSLALGQQGRTATPPAFTPKQPCRLTDPTLPCTRSDQAWLQGCR